MQDKENWRNDLGEEYMKTSEPQSHLSRSLSLFLCHRGHLWKLIIDHGGFVFDWRENLIVLWGNDNSCKKNLIEHFPSLLLFSQAVPIGSWLDVLRCARSTLGEYVLILLFNWQDCQRKEPTCSWTLLPSGASPTCRDILPLSQPPCTIIL